MTSGEDWALVPRLVADGFPQRQVARQLGIGRSTVARAVASVVPPKYVRRQVPTSFWPFKPRVRVLLAELPDMPTTVIAEDFDWDGQPAIRHQITAIVSGAFLAEAATSFCSARPEPGRRTVRLTRRVSMGPEASDVSVGAGDRGRPEVSLTRRTTSLRWICRRDVGTGLAHHLLA
jgi:hypothetical protein